MSAPKKLTPDEEFWQEHASRAKDAIEELLTVQADYESAFDDLTERQQESARGDAIQRILDLDLDTALTILDEALGTDLPPIN